MAKRPVPSGTLPFLTLKEKETSHGDHETEDIFKFHGSPNRVAPSPQHFSGSDPLHPRVVNSINNGTANAPSLGSIRWKNSSSITSLSRTIDVWKKFLLRPFRQDHTSFLGISRMTHTKRMSRKIKTLSSSKRSLPIVFQSCDIFFNVLGGKSPDPFFINKVEVP
jgi:hypothetical protein